MGVKQTCFLNMDASRIHLWAYCEYFKREGNWYSRLGDATNGVKTLRR